MKSIGKAYHLLVIDADGTIINRDGVISEEDINAITQVISNGVRVSLSTGRTLQSGLHVINQLKLNGCHIFFDGALVIDPRLDREIHARFISGHLVEQITRFAHLHNINLELFSTTQYFIEQETWASKIRDKYFGIKPTIRSFDGIWEQENIIKGTVVAASDEEKSKVEKIYRKFSCDLDDLTFSWTSTPAYPDVDFVNIVARGVSKGQALEALSAHLNIPLSEVVAIGDEKNDVPLLTTAGLAIAMDNAADEVKEAADYITLDVDNNGVAAAINRFLI